MVVDPFSPPLQSTIFLLQCQKEMEINMDYIYSIGIGVIYVYECIHAHKQIFLFPPKTPRKSENYNMVVLRAVRIIPAFVLGIETNLAVINASLRLS